jgi:hypothetical protein
MPTTCYIYTLHASNDPTCKPRYVGFTVRLIRRRIEHNTGRLCSEGRKGKWVRGLLALGEKVVMTVVHTFESDDTSERGIIEADWIEKYRDEFPDLLNDAPGGFGLAPCSPELRARRKVMNKGRVHSAETRAKVRASKLGKPRPPHVAAILRSIGKGRKLSAEHRAKIIAANTGRKHSPETCAAISVRNKGRKIPREAIEKAAAKRRGQKLSEMHKFMISLGGMGRKASAETRAKMSASLRGKKRTPEQRERIRQAAIRRWEDPLEHEKQSVAQKIRFL